LTMRKRLQIALAVLVVALVVMLARRTVRLREPVYQERRLSDWLQEYAAGGNPFVVVPGAKP
jgi:hypothetical protein